MLSPEIKKRFYLIFSLWVILVGIIQAQSGEITWSPSGNSFYEFEENEIVEYQLPSLESTILVAAEHLTPAGSEAPLPVELFLLSPDQSKILIYTNSKRVWRINSRGDYWVLELNSKTLKKIGESFPESSLMFAKFSPDGQKVAYVSENNIYVEDLSSGDIKGLTTDGTRKFINGTSDWVYEEEFFVRDGFRWSPDSRSVAYWQIDARPTPDFLMINNTDSVYSQVIPVQYPKVGLPPSSARIGVVNIENAQTTWMEIPGDPRQHYIVRMEFIPNTSEMILQQLNRKQNESKLIRCNVLTGSTQTIFTEQDEAWVDVATPDLSDQTYSIYFRHELNWIDGGKAFLWISEKDGWRHLYQISSDGSRVNHLTPGNYDIISFKGFDPQNKQVYFTASPDNATQQYLFRTRINGKGKLEKVTPENLQGTHSYDLSPNKRFAFHTFSNTYTRPVDQLISLPDHKPLQKEPSISQQLSIAQEENRTEFFKITTEEGVEMDGWMVKPVNFEAGKKYPVLFYVYTEPWGQLVIDTYGVSQNPFFQGGLAEAGYIYICLDNRGTPAPKGRAWRKSIYQRVGIINIRDQALAAKKILEWDFVDPDRIAVWGWSGGGSATLNLLFQYPEIYKTGIAVAAVANQLTYDNIYQERYMGLPQENLKNFIEGSPITYAKNLEGNLLYIHGTGDDNVHYQNAEMLVNELIKHNKQFQFMSYPNRTHGISEGEGTFLHLSTLYTEFLRKNCPPGGK
ncbi:S9 family peptidase [soil metagenome]